MSGCQMSPVSKKEEGSCWEVVDKSLRVELAVLIPSILLASTWWLSEMRAFFSS